MEDRNPQTSPASPATETEAPSADPGFRYATADELERASGEMLKLGMQCEALLVNSRINEAKNGQTPENDDHGWPVVVSDFLRLHETLPNLPDVILVPPGVYQVPANFFNSGTCRIVVGLPWARRDYPTLMLEGEARQIDHSATRAKTSLRVQRATDTRFSSVRLDALRPTVLEIDGDGSGFFSNLFMQCDFGATIEVLDFMTLHLGRDWAMAAYGPEYQVRGLGIKMLDSLHENAFGAVDAIFRPLVAAGGWYDKTFGQK
jgi:hypothetical protein